MSGFESDEEWGERQEREHKAQRKQALNGALATKEFENFFATKITAPEKELLATQHSRAVILHVPSTLDAMTVKQVRDLDANLVDELLRLESLKELIDTTRASIRKHTGVGAPLTD